MVLFYLSCLCKVLWKLNRYNFLKYNLLFKENKSIKISLSKLTLNNDNNKEKEFKLTVMDKLLQKLLHYLKCACNLVCEAPS